jgi:hypothetical protein
MRAALICAVVIANISISSVLADQSQQQQRPTRTASASFSPQYYLSAVPTGDCSVTCGEGTRNTTLVCLNRRQARVELSLCARLPRIPTPEVECRMPECERFELSVGEFSPCDATCGNGTRTRSVACRSKSTGRPTSLQQCNNRENVPTSVSCFTRCTATAR